MTDRTAAYLLRQLGKAAKGFDWSAQTPAAQNALIRAISDAVAYGEALDREKKLRKALDRVTNR